MHPQLGLNFDIPLMSLTSRNFGIFVPTQDPGENNSRQEPEYREDGQQLHEGETRAAEVIVIRHV